MGKHKKQKIRKEIEYIKPDINSVLEFAMEYVANKEKRQEIFRSLKNNEHSYICKISLEKNKYRVAVAKEPRCNTVLDLTNMAIDYEKDNYFKKSSIVKIRVEIENTINYYFL